eukprot:4597417-Pyramimonas_sp.AAC.1
MVRRSIAVADACNPGGAVDVAALSAVHLQGRCSEKLACRRFRRTVVDDGVPRASFDNGGMRRKFP